MKKSNNNYVAEIILVLEALWFVWMALTEFEFVKWFLINFALPFVILAIIGIRITINTEKMYDYFFRLAAFTFVIGMAMKFFTSWKAEFVPLWATVAFAIIGGYLWLQTFDLKNMIKQLIERIIKRIKKQK